MADARRRTGRKLGVEGVEGRRGRSACMVRRSAMDCWRVSSVMGVSGACCFVVQRATNSTNNMARGRMYLDQRNGCKCVAHEQLIDGPESHISEKTRSPPEGDCKPALFP